MGVADVSFPLACVACRRTGWPWCPACERRVAVLVPPICATCGAPALETLRRCRECPGCDIASLRAPFAFQGPVRSALHALKFGRTRAVARALAAAMAAVWHGHADVVTWVPLSERRRADRGFDQAEALGREVGAVLGVSPRPLLARTTETPPQARRTAEERRRALRGAFRVPRRPPARVLLVDDVYTTGSTASAAARMLRRAGAREVHVLVAARALSGPLPPRCYASDTVPSGSVVARG